MKGLHTLVFSLLAWHSAHSFAVKPLAVPVLAKNTAHVHPNGFALMAMPTSVSTLTNAVTSSIQAGPYGVLGLTAVASAVLVPITQIKTAWGFSVGYGLSVAAMALTLQSLFSPVKNSPAALLTWAAVFYGFRLASYILLRQLSGFKPTKGRGEQARIKRVPLSLSLALFYALETTPVLYALRSPVAKGGVGAIIALAGTILAWVGVALETVADFHKLAVLSNKDKDEEFVGPTKGVYQITRHPNYTGEFLFWLGTWIAGVPSFGESIVGFTCSTLGLYGILSIMDKASQGLEKRQSEKYSGQKTYDQWKKDVKTPLIPFVNE